MRRDRERSHRYFPLLVGQKVINPLFLTFTISLPDTFLWSSAPFTVHYLAHSELSLSIHSVAVSTSQRNTNKIVPNNNRYRKTWHLTCWLASFPQDFSVSPCGMRKHTRQSCLSRNRMDSAVIIPHLLNNATVDFRVKDFLYRAHTDLRVGCSNGDDISASSVPPHSVWDLKKDTHNYHNLHNRNM